MLLFYPYEEVNKDMLVMHKHVEAVGQPCCWAEWWQRGQGRGLIPGPIPAALASGPQPAPGPSCDPRTSPAMAIGLGAHPSLSAKTSPLAAALLPARCRQGTRLCLTPLLPWHLGSRPHFAGAGPGWQRVGCRWQCTAPRSTAWLLAVVVEVLPAATGPQMPLLPALCICRWELFSILAVLWLSFKWRFGFYVLKIGFFCLRTSTWFFLQVCFPCAALLIHVFAAQF